MAQVLIEENGLQWTARCPNCSDHFLITEEQERDGKQIAVPNTSKAPNVCPRCKCPMDPAKSRQFADKRAVADALPGQSPIIREVTVMEPTQDSVGPDDDDDDDDDDDE